MTIIKPTTLCKSGLVLIAATLVLTSRFPICGMFLGHGMDASGLMGLAVEPIALGAALFRVVLDVAAGCVLTIGLYLLMIWAGPRPGLSL